MSWNMLGHEWAVELLKEHVAGGRVRHAYLITGPQGVGRRTLALRLAMALNCLQPPAPGEFCGACRNCQQIERMQHPDLSVVAAEQRGATLKVERIRDLQHSLALAPYAARYRFAILQHFEEANDNAANALLKTLEEPPAQVILALTAQDAESLLPTILSRCEVLRLRALPYDQVSAWLQTRGLSPAQAELLAHVSGGRPGYALRLSKAPELLARRQEWLADLLRLLPGNLAERFAYVDPLFKDREALRGVLLTWLSFWRDVLLRAAGAAGPLANPDLSAEVERVAGWLGFDAARRALRAVERTLNVLETTATNPRLAAEVLMLDLPHMPGS